MYKIDVKKKIDGNEGIKNKGGGWGGGGCRGKCVEHGEVVRMEEEVTGLISRDCVSVDKHACKRNY